MSEEKKGVIKKYAVTITYERDLEIPPGGSAELQARVTDRFGVVIVRDAQGVIVDQVPAKIENREVK